MSQNENQPENKQDQVNSEVTEQDTKVEEATQQHEENGQASTTEIEEHTITDEAPLAVQHEETSPVSTPKATGWKVATGILAAATIGLAIYAFIPGSANNGTLAEVNGAKVSQNDVFGKIVEYNYDYVAEIVEASIDEKVIEQELKAKNITVTDADLDAELKAFRLKYPDDADFQNLLSYYGMSEEDLKNNLKQSTQLRLLLGDTVTVTDEQVQTYFDENKANFGAHGDRVRASHILVTDEALAKDIIAQLDAGADFATLAAQFGTDGTAQTGGDLGFFEYEGMIPEFSEAAFALAVDTYSKEPVKSTYGYHVILKTGEEGPYEPTLDSLKDAIKVELTNTEIYNTNPTYIDDLRNKAKVSNEFQTLYPAIPTIE